MEKIRFAIVGGGWRTEFFLQIARELPERFEITGMLVRNPEKGAVLEKKWGVKTVQTLDDLLKEKPRFAVVSVPWAVAPVMTRELAERGVPILSETPPAPDLEGLIALNQFASSTGARIQVAEQYQFQPLHAARIRIAGSGKIGTVTQAQISVCHGYHGVSLMRLLLQAGYENATIQARKFVSPIVSGPERGGIGEDEKVADSEQTIATVDFGGKLGIYDFTGDQYFSWIRSQHVLVRGDRGEIQNTTIKYLKDFRTPVQLELLRQDAGQYGNLEGYYHKGILAGEEWIYQNPFVPGRLSDDEIAVADCLVKMDEYARGGSDFYSLAEASQDHYLSMLINKAAETGETIRTETQPWAVPHVL